MTEEEKATIRARIAEFEARRETLNKDDPADAATRKALKYQADTLRFQIGEGEEPLFPF